MTPPPLPPPHRCIISREEIASYLLRLAMEERPARTRAPSLAHNRGLLAHIICSQPGAGIPSHQTQDALTSPPHSRYTRADVSLRVVSLDCSERRAS